MYYVPDRAHVYDPFGSEVFGVAPGITASSDNRTKKNKGGRGKGNNRQDDAGTRPGGRSKRHQDPPNASGGESSS